MACKWSGDFPSVVCFVEMSVNEAVVEATMNEINHHVSEEKECTHADDDKEPAQCAADIIIKLAVSIDLQLTA